MPKFAHVIAAAFLALAADVACGVEVVLLNNGQRLMGDVTERRDDGLTLQTPTASLRLRKDAYRSVTTEDRPEWYTEQARRLPVGRAVALFERATGAHPRHEGIRAALIEAYLKQGRGELRSGTLGAARMCFTKALAFDERCKGARDGLRDCDMVERRTNAEIQSMRREVEKNPENDYARLQLGIAYQRIGQRDRAFAEYQSIIRGKARFDGGVERIDDLRAFLESSIVLVPTPLAEHPADAASLGPEQKLTTEHFVLVHHDAKLAEEAGQSAEEAYRAALLMLGCKDPDSVRCPRSTIYLVPTRDEFIKATGNKLISGHASVDGTIYLHASDAAVARSTIRHEVAHLAAFRTIGGLPMWAGEGLAIRMELDCWLNYGRMRQIVKQKQFIPIADLIGVKGLAQFTDKPGADLFYQQAFTFADFLIEEHGGVAKLIEFARGAVDSPDAAAKKVYGVASLEELQRQWIEFVGL